MVKLIVKKFMVLMLVVLISSLFANLVFAEGGVGDGCDCSTAAQCGDNSVCVHNAACGFDNMADQGDPEMGGGGGSSSFSGYCVALSDDCTPGSTCCDAFGNYQGDYAICNEGTSFNICSSMDDMVIGFGMDFSNHFGCGQDVYRITPVTLCNGAGSCNQAGEELDYPINTISNCAPTQYCGIVGGAPSCSATPPSEICNNFDDDCVSGIDNGVSNCQCNGGVPGEEQCDGIDNDCDNSIDEGLDCACIFGESQVCGSNVGACSSGLQDCTIDGIWGFCNAQGPVIESCGDGIDGDCDGLSDESDPDCLEVDSKGVSYVFVNQQLMARVNPHKDTEFYQLDFIKNVRTVFNGEGEPTSFQDYTPFGENSYTIFSSLNYKSGLFDSLLETYLDYDPVIGRVLNPDGIKDLTNTQGINPYIRYNNPFRSNFDLALDFTLNIPEAPEGVVGSQRGASTSNTLSRLRMNFASKHVREVNKVKERFAARGGITSSVIQIGQSAYGIYSAVKAFKPEEGTPPPPPEKQDHYAFCDKCTKEQIAAMGEKLYGTDAQAYAVKSYGDGTKKWIVTDTVIPANVVTTFYGGAMEIVGNTIQLSSNGAGVAWAIKGSHTGTVHWGPDVTPLPR